MSKPTESIAKILWEFRGQATIHSVEPYVERIEAITKVTETNLGNPNTESMCDAWQESRGHQCPRHALADAEASTSQQPTESFEDQLAGGFAHHVSKQIEFAIDDYVKKGIDGVVDIADRIDSILAAHQATIDQRVADERVKLIAMALSDAASAAGQVKGLTGNPDPYWTRRLETLNRHLEEARSLTKKGESKS